MDRERLETKLFIPRDVDGEPIAEEIAKIREIEKELANDPDFSKAFVGLASFGSLLSGYSNDSKESDIDLFVLYDSKKTELRKFEERKEAPPSGEIKDVTLATCDINPENILAGLRGWLDQCHIDKERKIVRAPVKGEPRTIIALTAMTRVVTGNKINEYRKAISEVLKELPADEVDEVREAIIENLAYSDSYNLAKRKERMPELTETDHLEILEKRKEMWRARVKNVWGFENK